MNNNNYLYKRFCPKDIEKFGYKIINNNMLFFDKKNINNFIVYLPPPNITGDLHLGHAFNQTIVDCLIRYNYMIGKNTLCIPGIDHAGIATQILIERNFRLNNIDYNSISSNQFIKYAVEWKENIENNIINQIKRLGGLINWEYKYFTLGRKMSSIVYNAFVNLYKSGLLYRGKRLVNWDPILLTAVSDLEVNIKEEDGYLFYIKYKILNELNYIIIATTRPETIFGDSAVAVNPNDNRYLHLVGKYVVIPIINRVVPIIFDFSVDIKFGTGVVKITPAHDFNDYEIGKRFKLPEIIIFNNNATINNNAPKEYRKLNRFDARRKIILELKKIGLLKDVVKYKLFIPRSDRTGSIIEPMLTKQWFISVHKKIKNNYFNNKSISEIAFDFVKDKKIVFIPNDWNNTYYKWLENIKDWCISRQLTWGHRIPVWYGESNEIFIAKNEEMAYKIAKISKYNGKLKRDNDVLDTWFSSSLIPLLSSEILNYNESKVFFQSDILVTGFDIIFFWVTRMVMMTGYFTGRVAFKKVYIHGLIRDYYGKKMSKSKGNTLDPLDIIDGISLKNLIKKRTSFLLNKLNINDIKNKTKKEFPNGISGFGVDSLRFTMASLATFNRNINFSITCCEGYRNFCNKLWNASRFLLLNYKKNNNLIDKNNLEFSEVDRWIISLLEKVKRQVLENFHLYRFDKIASVLYKFVWNEYCDWYIEFSKVQINKGNLRIQNSTYYVLFYILKNILLLLHPIIPFITQFLWEKVILEIKNLSFKKKYILNNCYPKLDKKNINNESEKNISYLKLLINSCRILKRNLDIPITKKVSLFIISNNYFRNKYFIPYIKKIACLSEIKIINYYVFKKLNLSNLSFIVVGNSRLALDIKIDIFCEIHKISKEINSIKKNILVFNNKLRNIFFLKKAPEFIIRKEQKKISNSLYRINILKIQLLNVQLGFFNKM